MVKHNYVVYAKYIYLKERIIWCVKTDMTKREIEAYVADLNNSYRDKKFSYEEYIREEKK